MTATFSGRRTTADDATAAARPDPHPAATPPAPTPEAPTPEGLITASPAPDPTPLAGASSPVPIVPEPEVGMVQLLTPEGDRLEHPDYPLEISDEQIADLYRDLVLVRRLDTEAIALQRQGELGLWASLLGQEAAQIGAGRALREQDMTFPTYREHGVAWTRGVDPLSMLGLFRGTTAGGWDPREHNFGLYTIVIGAQTLHAAGYAMGIQHDQANRNRANGVSDPAQDSATLVFFGDGAFGAGPRSASRLSGPRRRICRWCTSVRTTSGPSPPR